MEKHVTSREISERLREAGVTLESEFIWYKDKSTARMDRPSGFMQITKRPPKLSRTDEWLPAYLASELMEMLPEEIDGFQITMTYAQGVWVVFYENPLGQEWNNTYFCDAKVQNAIAEMLIFLLENGHINVEELS